MKIEIDFSRPDELRKTKRELEMALDTINGALAAISKNVAADIHPTFPAMKNANVFEEVVGQCDAMVVVENLPPEFNMRDAVAAAKAAGVVESRLRREISDLIKSNKLTVIEKGQGRRPTTFRKA